MSQHLGQRIKNIRKSRKLSQEDLELDLNLGFGALSKIESGKRSPSRETVNKIIDHLSLNTWEVIYLLDLKSTGFSDLVHLSKKISSETNLDNIVSLCVNDICKELKLHGATVCIKEGDNIRFTTITQAWYTKRVLELVGLVYSQIRLPLTATENLIVRCLLENKTFYTTRCSEFVVPILPAEKVDILQKFSGAKCSIILPLRPAAGDPVGVVVFSKEYIDDFSVELPILECFCEVIAESIIKQQRK